MEKEREIQLGELLRRLGIALKKNWILMAVIIAISAVIGVCVSFYRKPVYIASQSALYSVELDPSKPDIYDHTMTANMRETVVAFCSQPAVLARANKYYARYLKEGVKTDEGLAAFIATIKQENATNTIQTIVYAGENYIKAQDVTVIAAEKDAVTPDFSIVIRCKDMDAAAAKAKVGLLLLAVDDEAKVPALEGGIGTYKYFEARVVLEDLGYVGTGTDVSKIKIVLISTIIGFVLAVVVVCLMYLLNRTCREKEELEAITGVDVLAIIEKSKGGKQ